MSKLIDLTGKRFGRLTVISRAENTKSGKARWLCRCDCGEETTVLSSNLIRGLTLSCKCLNNEMASQRFTRHGMSNHRLYKIWSGMVKRCYNQRCKSYPAYGGRGIKVCEDWRYSFESFAQWAITNGYEDSLSIDRENVNGDYAPDNCQWATKTVQANNTRANHTLTYDGETHTLAEWGRITGISQYTILKRVRTLGWTVEEALTTATR